MLATGRGVCRAESWLQVEEFAEQNAGYTGLQVEEFAEQNAGYRGLEFATELGIAFLIWKVMRGPFSKTHADWTGLDRF